MIDALQLQNTSNEAYDRKIRKDRQRRNTRMISPFDCERRHIMNNYPLEFFKAERRKDNIPICKQCESTKIMVISPGIYQCSICLSVLECKIESVLTHDNNPFSVLKTNNYQRRYHFESYLDQLNKSYDLDDNDKIKILNYKKKYKVKYLTANKIRIILKYYKLSKLYKYVPHIYCKLNNKQMPIITDIDRERISNMFIKLDQAWSSIKKGKSMAGCQFFLRKILELLDIYDDFLEIIPLVNSRETIEKNDRIWRKICHINLWDPIPTYI